MLTLHSENSKDKKDYISRNTAPKVIVLLFCAVFCTAFVHNQKHTRMNSSSSSSS